LVFGSDVVVLFAVVMVHDGHGDAFDIGVNILNVASMNDDGDPNGA